MQVENDVGNIGRMLPWPVLLLQNYPSQNYKLIHFYKRKVLIDNNNADRGSILIIAEIY